MTSPDDAAPMCMQALAQELGTISLSLLGRPAINNIFLSSDTGTVRMQAPA